MTFYGKRAFGALALVLVLGTAARADWNLEDPAKWVQLPDLTPTGIDIDTDGCSIIADDFLCTSAGKITDIHFWGSWANDVKSSISKLHLTIYSDDRTGPFSKPGDILWARPIDPMGQGTEGFTERLYTTIQQGNEAFWKPNSGAAPQTVDTQVFQYNIYIDPANAFFQAGQGTIYWLRIRAEIDESQGARDFGWKTRDPSQHFEDDAVYFDTENLVWKELKYPNDPRFGSLVGRSIDMAFVITPEPTTLALLGLGGLSLILGRKRK